MDKPYFGKDDIDHKERHLFVDIDVGHVAKEGDDTLTVAGYGPWGMVYYHRASDGRDGHSCYVSTWRRLVKATT